MRTSESIAKLADALAKAQSAITHAAKDAKNPHFQSRYADLAAVWEACRTQLSANGIAVIQSPEADGNRVTVTTLLAHASGEWVQGALTLTARQADPQSVGSAITYGRRYGLASMVGVAPDDDDDGEAAQGRSKDSQRERRTERPREAPRQSAPAAAPVPSDTITQEQRRRLVALSQERGYTKDDMKVVLAAFGYENSKDIATKDYHAVMEAIETGTLPGQGAPGTEPTHDDAVVGEPVPF